MSRLRTCRIAADSATSPPSCALGGGGDDDERGGKLDGRGGGLDARFVALRPILGGGWLGCFSSGAGPSAVETMGPVTGEHEAGVYVELTVLVISINENSTAQETEPHGFVGRVLQPGGI